MIAKLIKGSLLGWCGETRAKECSTESLVDVKCGARLTPFCLPLSSELPHAAVNAKL